MMTLQGGVKTGPALVEARNAELLKRWKLYEMDLAGHELYVRSSIAQT